MDKETVLKIIAGVLGNEAEEDGDCVKKSIENPMEDKDVSFYKYKVMENDSIRIEKWADNESCDMVVIKSVREIVWRSCRLEKICSIYQKQYEMWRAENDNIPFIETNIIDEADGSIERTFTYVRNFWRKNLPDDLENNKSLRLLLAEYGVGKSSLCQSIRFLTANEIEKPFLKEEAAFPFVFDLNNFRSGDFDKFIETELFGTYHLPLTYSVFEKMCRNGIFMVVLDAWDQMNGTRKVLDVRQDLNQMSSLWEEKGRVLITCRRSFYQKQLKEKGKLSQDVRLYNLIGFDERSVTDYFRKHAVERRLKETEPLLDNEAEWVKECWKLNSELLAKPLNLRLLVKHFGIINDEIDFKKQKANTYQFLEIVLRDWMKQNNVTNELFLKELVSQTLFSGLNRSIPLRQFREACKDEKWEIVNTALSNFDFVKINDKEERIEFCLAAFQEFLWAHFALDELQREPERLDNKASLIKNYILIKEVREWICMILTTKVSNCLKDQIAYVKYKRKEDVGYRGPNALTLLCDLNRIPFYREQFKNIKKDLTRRPLMGTDFRGMDLSGADFYGSNLEGADFSYTNLNDATFTSTDLSGTVWREHGRMKKCAFLDRDDTLCLVAGTKSGGVLTYRIDNGGQEVVNLQNDVINDLAGDRGGIYTASSDGWVGYIDKRGNLRNVYIAQSGLQSIAHTKKVSCVYVGADNQEIYRYNWSSGSKQRIEVDLDLGDENERISDIHYYSDGKDDYIAYTLHHRKLLVLLKLTGMYKGEVIAKGMLSSEDIRFGDICFADEMLIYSVESKGIFGILVNEAIADIPEEELLNENQRLLLCPDAKGFSLSWANSKKRLFAVVAVNEKETDSLYEIDVFSDCRKCDLVELDWQYGEHNYDIMNEEIEGFSVSDDGEYIAFSGKSLSVFHKAGSYYELSAEPIEAKIACQNTKFLSCTGTYKDLIDFWKSRGATI